MTKTINLENDLWEKLCLKSQQYRCDSLTVLKSIGLQLCSMWYPDSEKNDHRVSWIESCQIIEHENKDKNIISKNDFSFRLQLKEQGVDIVIEGNDDLGPILEGMKESILQMIEYLENHPWGNNICDFLPESQRQKREEVNHTDWDIQPKCLHERFFENALKKPDTVAVIWYENGIKKVMTYKELENRSLKTANMLIEKGVKEGDLVAINLPKGIEQITGVLGILAAGGAYVPIGVGQPIERKRKIINTGKIRFILTSEKWQFYLSQIEGTEIIFIDEIHRYKALYSRILGSVDSTAYIIFTSGSSGEPKGVIIPHRSVYNTIADINQKFEVTENDCGIGISELDFDLSVYDIFGLLSAGGSLVVVNERDKKEAVIWNQLIQENGVTLWNSVPALFDMLLSISELEDNRLPLKKIFLSGDWIKMDLFSRTTKLTNHCKFIALGGATEASIWSNYYEVHKIEKSWRSIPYGMPLGNQKMKVVDQLGRDCPDYISGELWIGGDGVAQGYLNQEKLTKERFVTVNGMKWYKTGDIARYQADGVIEFLGRMDNQVKLHGFRIELGEIENVLKKYQWIDEAVAGVIEDENIKYLTAIVVPSQHKEKRYFQRQQIKLSPDIHQVDDGIKERAAIVEKFLTELCFADNLVIDNFKIERICCDQTKDLFRMWISWLKSREVIAVKKENVVPGSRYDKVLNNEKIKETGLGKILFSRIEIFRKIVKGEIPPTVVLDFKELSPEYLNLQGFETIYCLKKMIQGIQEQIEEQSLELRIAVLGAGTGLATQQIISILGNKVKVTLFDNSLGMLTKAKERLSEYSDQVEYKVISDGYIDRKHLYRYDFVIAVNSMHRYLEPSNGVNIAAILLKSGGKLLAVEYLKLDPVALVTSAILENGFSNFSPVRSRKNTPLLTEEEWQKVFENSNFSVIKMNSFPNSSAAYIEAVITKQNNILEDKILQEYLRQSLPHYMFPERMEVFPWTPLNKNGKIDRSKIIQSLHKNNLDESVDKDPYIGMEEEIVAIWEEMLQCKHIGRNQSFFEIGGDSLLATRFLANIKRLYHIDFSLRDMFEYPRLCQVAGMIDNKIDERGLLVEGEI